MYRKRIFKGVKVGERGRNRTYNLLIKSQLLCQLSYAPVKSVANEIDNVRDLTIPAGFCSI
jgi:hypothetical protein